MNSTLKTYLDVANLPVKGTVLSERESEVELSAGMLKSVPFF